MFPPWGIGKFTQWLVFHMNFYVGIQERESFQAAGECVAQIPLPLLFNRKLRQRSSATGEAKRSPATTETIPLAVSSLVTEYRRI